MAQLFGAHTVEVPERPGYVQDLDATLAAITPRTRQVYITSPNNPTGTIVTAERDRRLHVARAGRASPSCSTRRTTSSSTTRRTRCGTFARDATSSSCARSPRFRAWANLRIGYGMASAEMIEILQKTRQPFNVNGIAQAGALAGLADAGHQARTKAVTDEGRAFLQGAFAEMGVEFVPSYANFVLAQVGDGRAVFEALLRRGIIVRAMGSYKLPAWIRVSVGTMKENTRFIDALKELHPLG